MKKAIKTLATLAVLLAVPALAGLGIMALWNCIIPAVCGFASITFYQAVGLFLIGQLMSSGFIIALFGGFGSIHAIIHPRRDWHGHWHNMSEEERRKLILRRREFFGFRNHNGEDAPKG